MEVSPSHISRDDALNQINRGEFVALIGRTRDVVGVSFLYLEIQISVLKKITHNQVNKSFSNRSSNIFNMPLHKIEKYVSVFACSRSFCIKILMSFTYVIVFRGILVARWTMHTLLNISQDILRKLSRFSGLSNFY